MVSALRHQLRLKLLLLLDAAAVSGLAVDMLHQGVVSAGVAGTLEEITREVSYLSDKSLVSRVENPLAPELPRIRITAVGRDFLASEGF